MLFLASLFIFTACQEDDYVEIVGVCPLVLTTDPVNLAVGVPLDKTITVTFNTEMKPSTINATSLVLYGTDTIAGTITYSGTTASFKPLFNLSPFTTYTGTVTTAVKDTTGNALQQKYVWTFNTGAPGINLGSTSRFGILAGSGITSTGFSEVRNGDIGVSPGLRSSIIGFPQAIVVNGEIYASDDFIPAGIPAMLIQAHNDLTTAYQYAKSVTSPDVTLFSGDLGGRTLTQGIYHSSTIASITSGNLTLDAKGDPNAYWIFQIGSDFSTNGSAGGDVILAGGAKPSNIYWLMEGLTTIGSNTSFNGTILSLTTIRMNANATIEGRLLTSNGAVILANTNTILKP